MKKSRFKKGQTVWSGRGKHEKQLVVKKVHKNPMLPIYQYTFEAPNDGFACGEQSLRENREDRDLILRECLHEDETATRFNTIFGALRNPKDFKYTESGDVSNIFKEGGLFFKPDLMFCKWLTEYANGRFILDVGAGQGHLVNMLKRETKKVMGIEPNLNKEWWIKWRMNRDGGNIDINEMQEWTIKQAKTFINSLGADRVLLVFARPESDFVQEGIDYMPEGMEALYITVPNTPSDLGHYKNKAVLIEHGGYSEDNEVVYSIKK